MILASKQQGYLTMITIVLIVVMGFIAVALAYVFSGSAFMNTNFESGTGALFIAESGLEAATHKLLGYDIANRSVCSGLNLTNNSFGGGIYTVTSTGPFYVSAPTTLNGALTANATTIPVVSTANYQSSGRIMIDRELINYSAVNSTNFLNAVRGVDGSTATTHATGTVVSQNQCNLSSDGGDVTLTPTNPGDPGGIRELNENIQLQEAWAVGENPGTNAPPSIARFNGAAWSNFPNGLDKSTALRGISMISYADGWAVGDKSGGEYVAEWNGSTWARYGTSSSIPNVNLTSVFCLDTNNCHIVGVQQGNNPLILRWTGAGWTRIIPTGASKTSLRSVQCDTTNDCWTVGDNTGGNNFYQWNGTTWITVNVGALSGFTFNGVFCNTSTDCWAVGANNIFARRNGAAWANVSVAQRGNIPSAVYNGIYCNASNDCWAVGNVSSSQALMVHWNGTTWSRDTSYPAPAVNLNAVTCANTNDCWAVGNTSAGQPVIDHWDGSAWSNIAVSGLGNAGLFAVDIVHPNSQPWSAWTENFS